MCNSFTFPLFSSFELLSIQLKLSVTHNARCVRQEMDPLGGTHDTYLREEGSHWDIHFPFTLEIPCEEMLTFYQVGSSRKGNEIAQKLFHKSSARILEKWVSIACDIWGIACWFFPQLCTSLITLEIFVTL